MPSTISAGTTAGTAIAVAGDTTGNLAFQTNGTTTAMTIDTSQNVGIGTTSPTTKLEVSGSGIPAIVNSSNNQYVMQFSYASNTSKAYIGTFNNALVFAPSSGTEAARIDSSGNLGFNSGYGSVATAYGCRAWVNFNGTGTVAIRASGNVSSITDNDTGDYTVNFTTAMPDANYSASGATLGSQETSGGALSAGIQSGATAPATGSVRISTRAAGVTRIDCSYVQVAVFR